jgi:chromodomain protein Y
VTGPAIGLGSALLPLCDIVYASDKATFYMPYAQLSQTPEGCASFTLPNIVGIAMVSVRKYVFPFICYFIIHV